MEIDDLFEDPVILEIDQQTEDKVSASFSALFDVGYPVLSGGLNSSTGEFDIKVDEARAYDGIEQEIQDFVGDYIHVNIWLGPNDARFQGISN